jgi:hypothetical protein
MVLLVAVTLYVLPPVTLGRYSTIQQCELDRAALVEQFVRNPTMMSEVTVICQNIDKQAERGRSEFHGQKQ